jgi:peptide/nickel transport system ATP-binding protein/oligopeptide transport system ATP-binding protein
MQIVFQDPFSSLNPRQTVLKIIGEPLIINKVAVGDDMRDRVLKLIAKVNLPDDAIDRFPHEFSGGQRQRICIARALALNPEFIVLDEPTSALDVSVQSQVINQLLDLQKELNLSYLFISHNLIVEKYICDRIAVMYLGKVMENADKDDLFADPMHPYTQALLSAIPLPDPTLKRRREVLKGDVPSPINPPSGCRFHTRCPKAMAVCSKEEPLLKTVGKGKYDHFVACHLY